MKSMLFQKLARDISQIQCITIPDAVSRTLEVVLRYIINQFIVLLDEIRIMLNYVHCDFYVVVSR